MTSRSRPAMNPESDASQDIEEDPHGHSRRARTLTGPAAERRQTPSVGIRADDGATPGSAPPWSQTLSPTPPERRTTSDSPHARWRHVREIRAQPGAATDLQPTRTRRGRERGLERPQRSQRAASRRRRRLVCGARHGSPPRPALEERTHPLRGQGRPNGHIGRERAAQRHPGRAAAKQGPDGAVPVETGTEAAPDTPPKAPGCRRPSAPWAP